MTTCWTSERLTSASSTPGLTGGVTTGTINILLNNGQEYIVEYNFTSDCRVRLPRRTELEDAVVAPLEHIQAPGEERRPGRVR